MYVIHFVFFTCGVELARFSYNLIWAPPRKRNEIDRIDNVRALLAELLTRQIVTLQT